MTKVRLSQGNILNFSKVWFYLVYRDLYGAQKTKSLIFNGNLLIQTVNCVRTLIVWLNSDFRLLCDFTLYEISYVNFTLFKSMRKSDFNQTFWHVPTRISGKYTHYTGKMYHLYFWVMGLNYYKKCAAFLVALSS